MQAFKLTTTIIIKIIERVSVLQETKNTFQADPN